MAIQNRTVTIKNIFAENANTTIPNPPVPGESYRNTSTTAVEIGEGWPFKEIVDSAKFNESMYEYTTICKQLEEYGFLPWCADTDYPAGGCALGTDGNVYQAKVATGPSTTSFDPVNDTSHTYWDLFYYSSFTASRAIASDANGKLKPSSTTATELGYVHGVTSAIQTQINAKANNNAVVHLTGDETITGFKTFKNDIFLGGVAGSGQEGGQINFNAGESETNQNVFNFDRRDGEFRFFGVGLDGNVHVPLRININNNLVYANPSDVSNTIVTTTGISKSGNGFVRLGNGIIIQWGWHSGSGSTLTFPTPFTSTNYSVAANYRKQSSSGSGIGHVNFYPTSTTSCYFNSQGGDFQWVAIGY